MHSSNNYDFRKTMLQIHRPDIRCLESKPVRGEFVISDGLVIQVPADANVVTKTAAADFCDFLSVSMNIAATVAIGEIPEPLKMHQRIILEEASDDADPRPGFTVKVDKQITVSGTTERGVAQGLYWLEDNMAIRHAPYLKKGTFTRRCAFEKRTAYSAYGVDDFPDAYLSKLAHAGYTTIGLYFTSGANESVLGFYDINTLIHRAEKYGLDVHIYAHIPSKYHPDDPAAIQYYDSTYGKLFAHCPEITGVILVGENNEFPSKDPATAGKFRTQNFVDNIPTGKPSPGWYPCSDYPQWLELIKTIIHKYSPDTQIIFATYNWSYMDTETRLAFLRTLPKDITLLVDMELGELRRYGGGAVGYCSDYTISHPGPGTYFKTEAAEAKRLGIRLSCYSGTGGMTWDMGTIPYQPVAYAWMERYAALMDKSQGWDISELEESIHFGVHPSFISDLAKRIFFNPDGSMDQALSDVLSMHFGSQNVPVLKKVLRLWSQGAKLNTPAIEHQYGPDRIGPSYPLCLMRDILPTPESYAIHGQGIFPPRYTPRNTGKCALSSVRMPAEQKRLCKMLELFRQGIHLAKTQCKLNAELQEVIGIMEFWANSAQTTLHVKQWYLVTERFKIETDLKKIDELIRQMEQIANAEIQNAEATIPLVQANSRLGWEPTMEYQCDEAHLRWKIRQVRYVLDVELEQIKKSRNLS